MLTYISISLSAGIWLYLVYRYDRFEPEPVKYVLLIGAFGGLLSAVPAAFFNTIVSALTGASGFLYQASVTEADRSAQGKILFSLFVGFNEEFWKSFIAVMILRKFKEFNEPIDALIYSMSIALGFAAFENIGYTAAGGLGVLLVRSFTAVPLHAGLASIWGSGIAQARYNNGERYLQTLVPYVVTASLLHALYNYIQFIHSDDPVSLVLALIFAFFITSYAAGKLRYYRDNSPFRRTGLCPECGTLNHYFSRYCKNCGGYIATDYYALCESCGVRKRPGAVSCRNCGETGC